jgi:hypothetical protein
MTKLAILILALSASSAAIAENTAPQLDPNEVICRTVRATGSRIGTSRRCATRAQWLEDERAQRAQLAERQTRQTQPTCMNPAERARVNGRYASAAIGSSCGY